MHEASLMCWLTSFDTYQYERIIDSFFTICVRQNVDFGTRETVESCRIAKKRGSIKIGFVGVNVAFFIQQLQRISPLEKMHILQH